METKFKVELKDDSDELILSEGSSAIGRIGIIGQGRKPITMKEIADAIDKDNFNKFLSNVEAIKSCNNPDMRIVMTEDAKERIISYAHKDDINIDEYLNLVETVSGIHSNEIVLAIPSPHDFEGDILNSINFIDNKQLLPGDEMTTKVHHRGKYTKKRKYKNKKKRR